VEFIGKRFATEITEKKKRAQRTDPDMTKMI
jgi:hypothetical protein